MAWRSDGIRGGGSIAQARSGFQFRRPRSRLARPEMSESLVGRESVWACASRKGPASRASHALLQEIGLEPIGLADLGIHYVWSLRYLLSVVECDTRPSIKLELAVRLGSTATKRAAVIHEWHKSALHDAIPPLIAKWAPKLGVVPAGYFLQRMKTKWGSCNPRSQCIRLNTELVKKPRDLLEYVVIHELLHLIEPTHSERFVRLLDTHYPTWRDARSELNELPLAAER